MKVEARIFDIVTVFAFLVAIVYAVMTGYMTNDGVEPIGTVALILTGALALLVGSYFRFVSRRIEPRPEDREEAEIADGAGELGFFSPGSYWPVALAACAALGGVALAFFQIWLLVLAIIALLIAVGGLVFEYHTGPSHH
ncbi:cytochrome C oxidase subunit IV [Prauserella sp. PE36]|uniref:Cytochrome c oxidase polypeptide 4 n=1 Tax=Prauserella endophytica TaxID=1592324 RepID=A0ABY2S6D0_9PSEU|nr:MULTISPECIES: cytochrome c oxidase subunit 4 [Prauserella]PXY21700.1 cytochrome C oxidase subunit IV [Prauserella coralliicola]RBM20078.1 cytochrome C oxidase subunit IV [Prauserella sp. PE36]TKG71484.1 cytochrome c oxidase subunit 4 [Prauserella endophytica]